MVPGGADVELVSLAALDKDDQLIGLPELVDGHTPAPGLEVGAVKDALPGAVLILLDQLLRRPCHSYSSKRWS